MHLRRLLLALGFVFVLAGLGLSVVWVRMLNAPANTGAQREQVRPARLVAVKPLPTGTMLRVGDFEWKESVPGQAPVSGAIMRGQMPEYEIMGAITRRPFAEGEPIIAIELVKPTDKRFLAAVLRPDHRAVSIAVDAPQSASGLLLAGDFVDVILTQNLGEAAGGAGKRAVSETVLRNVRVVAVDHTLAPQSKPSGDSSIVSTEARIPKTITLEVTERQGQALFVATQLGRLQVAVRALAGSGNAQIEEARKPAPITWAAEVSPALVGGKGGQISAFDALRKQVEAMVKQVAPNPKRRGPVALRDASCNRRIGTGSAIERNIRWAPRPECM